MFGFLRAQVAFACKAGNDSCTISERWFRELIFVEENIPLFLSNASHRLEGVRAISSALNVNSETVARSSEHCAAVIEAAGSVNFFESSAGLIAHFVVPVCVGVDDLILSVVLKRKQ